jgi:hypothetical protein
VFCRCTEVARELENPFQVHASLPLNVSTLNTTGTNDHVLETPPGRLLEIQEGEVSNASRGFRRLSRKEVMVQEHQQVAERLRQTNSPSTNTNSRVVVCTIAPCRRSPRVRSRASRLCVLLCTVAWQMRKHLRYVIQVLVYAYDTLIKLDQLERIKAQCAMFFTI